MSSAPPPTSARRQRAEQEFARGNALLLASELAAAAVAFASAAKLDPRHVTALSNLGSVLRKLGQPEAAARAYRSALRLEPDSGALHFNLSVALQAMGARDEAEQALRKAIALQPGLAQAHVNLGLLLSDFGRKEEALVHLRRAVELTPDDLFRRRNLRETVARLVPAWHFPMMNDGPRNDAYDRAIRKAVRPGMHVLDIGTGGGLLALMAARAGAARVTTCEMVGPIAACAREIVAANGFADRVNVLAMKSTDVVVGRDMPARADLVVSEILSSELIGEGVVPALRHAHAELLAPGAASVPKGGAVMACLVGGEAFGRHFFVGRGAGFELAAFNAFRPEVVSLQFQAYPWEPMSDEVVVLNLAYPFRDDPPPLFSAVFRADRSGRCFGVGQWIRIDLDDEIAFANHPSAPATEPSGWQHIFYPFERPLAVAAGQSVEVAVACTGRKLIFDLPKVR